jgi:hypothetical protein
MKNIFYILILLPTFLLSQSSKWDYIGNINFDEKTDRKDFILCDENQIYQYFNNSGGVEFDGEKIAIEKMFEEKYHPENTKKESGLVRIRFVVNCKGETDRFRILGMDENYQEKKFDDTILNQLLTITKNLKSWKPKTYNNTPIDYYQYLIFKIKDGKINEILP